MRAGQDPAIERDLKAQEVGAMPTVAEFADIYIAMYAKPGKNKKGEKSWKEDARHLNADVAPALDEVKRTHIIVLLDKKEKAGYVVARNRLLAMLSTYFKFCSAAGHIESNPASGVQRIKEQSRQRVLSHDEILFLWQQTDGNSKLSEIISGQVESNVIPLHKVG